MVEQNSSMVSVLEFLNENLRKFTLKETEWLIQKNISDNRIIELESQVKSLENINYDLTKRIKMLEFVLMIERNKLIKLGGNIETEIKYNNTIILNEFNDKRELVKEEDLKKIKEMNNKPSLMKVLYDCGLTEEFANELFKDLEINRTDFERIIKENIEEKKENKFTLQNIENKIKIPNNQIEQSYLSSSSHVNSVLTELNTSQIEEEVKKKIENKVVSMDQTININFSNFIFFRSHIDVVRKLDYLPNIDSMVSISEDCQIKLWSLKDLQFNSNQTNDVEPYQVLRGHTGPLYSLTVSNDEFNLIYTAGNEGIIKVWKAQKYEDVIPYGSTEEVNCNVGLILVNNEVVWDLKHHPNQNLLVSLSSDSSVNFWRTTTPWEYRQWMNDEKYTQGFVKKLTNKKNENLLLNPTTCCFFNSEPNLISIGYNDSTVNVYDMVKEKFLYSYGQNSNLDAISMLNYQPNCITCDNNNILYAGYEDGSLKVIDIRENKIVKTQMIHSDAVTSINILNEKYKSTTGHDGQLKLWDIRSLTCLQELNAHNSKFNESIWSSIFIKNYSYLATAGADSLIKVYKL